MGGRIEQAGWPVIVAPWLSSHLDAGGGRFERNSARAALLDRVRSARTEAANLRAAVPWDLALLDPFLLWAYPMLAAVGPCAALSTKPLLTPDPLVPPWSSNLVPSDGIIGRAQTQAVWVQARLGYLGYRARCQLDEWLKGWSHRSLANLCCKLSGHDRADWACRPVPIDMRYRSAGELILHAREFDLPRRAPLEPGVAYLGPCLSARPLVAPVRTRSADLPKLVCSLGTEMPEAQALSRYRAVVAAMNHLPDAQLVLSAGSPALAARLAEDAQRLGPRVRIAPWVDLRAELAGAAVAILHGGANSAKEAIMARCPIVPLPARADQPGIAARIVFHGLGRMPAAIEPVAIAGTVAGMLQDPGLVISLDRMATCFEGYDVDQTASRIIEQLALQRARSGPRSNS